MPLLQIERRFTCRPAHSLIIILTNLSKKKIIKKGNNETQIVGKVLIIKNTQNGFFACFLTRSCVIAYGLCDTCKSPFMAARRVYFAIGQYG
jgi:hypothetical protein